MKCACCVSFWPTVGSPEPQSAHRVLTLLGREISLPGMDRREISPRGPESRREISPREMETSIGT